MDLNTVEQLVPASGRASVDAFAPGDAWLAGGSGLFAAPNPSLRRLLDLHALDWPPLTATADGLEIAATCTIAQLAAYAAPTRWPALGIVRACCESLRGSFKVWHVATVGGNVCVGLPAGPMTSLTAGLAGTCRIWQPGGGDRVAAVADVVIGDGRTSLAPGELLRSITLPAAALRGRAAMRQASLTPMGRSAALLVARLDEPHGARGGGAFHLTITASVPRPRTLRFAGGVPSSAELDAAIEQALAPGDYFDDPHGTPRWRRHLTRRLARELRDELAA
ncbi:MAG: FAD binding domain-containing protein [Patulibacter minatonensis]